MVSEEVMLQYIGDSHQCAGIDGVFLEYAINVRPVARNLFGQPDNSLFLSFQFFSDSFPDVHSYLALLADRFLGFSLFVLVLSG